MTMSAPGRLRCEYRVNPLGIDVAQPRLSWELRDDRRGARQTACQLRAAGNAGDLADGKCLLWDSGRVEGDQSVHVSYEGPAVVSKQRCYWQVRTWDADGAESPWSEPAWFEMGLLDRKDWEAEWIASPLVGGPRTTVPVPYMRKDMTLDGEVASARLYITALGVFEASINGQRVGEDVLAPGWTYFPKQVRYHVYDVADLLEKGDNTLGAILGDGWYCGHIEKLPRQVHGDRPKLIARLEIELEDGSKHTVLSDGSWKTWFGPLLEADLIMGEAYDARLEMPGWDRPGFDDSGWLSVKVMPDEGMALVAYRGPTMRCVEEIEPIAEPRKGRHGWVFDLGQNMIGVVRVKVEGDAGKTITIRHAEMMNPNDSLHTENLRTARATDYYTLSGNGVEEWTPRFTFHGFQYVELQGFPGTPARDAVTGVVICSDMAPTGRFECSDQLVNQLQHNIQWGQKGNFLDVPTDCPQRDERLGWTGDAQVFVRTACFNMEVAGFFTKWLQDIRDAQSPEGKVPAIVPISAPGLAGTDGGPAWADATTICALTVYEEYGDEHLLAEHYECMARYVEYQSSTAKDFRRCWDGCGYNQGFGDWLALDGSGKTDGGTPKELIGTAFFARSTRLVAQAARVLGKYEDAAKYEEQCANIRQAFQDKFVTASGLIAGQTQTCYVLALHFDLLPDDLREAALAELVRDIEKRGMQLSTGFVGTSYLPHVLTRFGRTDVAYALLAQKKWPSWLYAVTQGATTIW
ncbi:family 78 glycoside hydrolase catalytic domain, partial [Verrucomicrobiota bacterium]